MPDRPNINQKAGEFYRVRLWKSRVTGLPLYPFAIEETMRLFGPVNIQNTHSHYLIIFVMEGKIVHHYGNISYTLVPGNVLLLSPGTFSFQSNCGYHKFLIGLKGWEIERLWLSFGLENFQKITMETKELLKIFCRIDRNLGRKNGGNVPEMLGDSFKLLALISQAKHIQSNPSSKSLAERIREKLESCVNAPLKLNKLGEELGIPLPSLYRIFSERFGISPKRFHTDMRMRHAMELLEFSEFSMKEIAAQTGFQNQYYFSNAIKKAYGCAPLELRWRLREEHVELSLPPQK